MSGGSYDYLCYKDSENIWEYTRQIEEMADRLSGLGYAKDAACATVDVLLEIRRATVRIDAMTQKLHDVWRAVEWWDSCDSGEDAVKRALDEYRGISAEQPSADREAE